MPPPAKRSAGKTVGIVIGIVAGVCVICVALGALAWPSFKQGFDEGMRRAGNATSSASPSASPTHDITAVPAVGLCYASTQPSTIGRGYYTGAEKDIAVPCSKSHDLETVAVGTLADNVANTPASTASSVIDAYNQCSAAVDAFLGQPWAGAYAWAVISVPSSLGWSKGAHWYRCDVIGSNGVGNPQPVKTSGSLKGAAKAITCLSWIANSDGSDTNTQGAACDVPHNGEVIGAGPMPSGVDLADRGAVEEAVGQLCHTFVVSYMGEDHLTPGLWMSYFRPHQTQADGMLDQDIICIIGTEDRSRLLVGSLKDLGNKPIPYAS